MGTEKVPGTVKRNRVVVGLSGGVDSAVAAWLLKQEGHEVIGVFMKNWEDDDTEDYCPARQDLIDAVSVADTIGIEVDAVNFSREYRERVFRYFLDEYQAGRTPNPDVLCNSEIKFKCFLDHALAMGADGIATGHYAGVRETDSGFELLRARDLTKDQSYFLHRLDQKQLSRTQFPLYEWKKTDVRALAQRIGLSNATKKDSTGICFIGERPFRDFLNRYLPAQPGDIEDVQGRKLGRHAGLMFHTIGQRQGLGIGGQGLPWYVVSKDVRRNALIVVQGHDHPELQSRHLEAGSLAWISGSAPSCEYELAAKTRYRQTDCPCSIQLNAETGRMLVRFNEQQWAVTPGQSVVLYSGDLCLGGGVIDRTIPEHSPDSHLPICATRLPQLARS